MPNHLQELTRLYETLKAQAKLDISSAATGRHIHDVALNALRFLRDECQSVPLKSLVPMKQYFAFSKPSAPQIVCIPANASLFDLDPDRVSANWQAWWEGKLNPADLARMSYTIALAPCLAMELYDRQNKKQPATYFECLIGHISNDGRATTFPSLSLSFGKVMLMAILEATFVKYGIIKTSVLSVDVAFVKRARAQTGHQWF